MEELNNLIYNLMSEQGEIEAFGPVTLKSMPVLAVTAVVSLLICVLGLKLVRVWNVLTSLAVGLIAGAAVSLVLRLEMPVSLIVPGAAMVILAVLAGIFKRFGAFILSVIAVSEIVLSILKPDNWIFIGISVAVGLVAAILVMIWFEPMVIVVTSLYGGFGLGEAILGLTGLTNLYLSWAIYAVIVIIGMVIQFTMKSGEIKRRDRRRAEAIKEEHSVESEIDKARAMLDIDDEDDDY